MFFAVFGVDSGRGFSDYFDASNQRMLQLAILTKLLKSNVLYKSLCLFSSIQNVA
jgi:hypothetical protein